MRKSTGVSQRAFSGADVSYTAAGKGTKRLNGKAQASGCQEAAKAVKLREIETGLERDWGEVSGGYKGRVLQQSMFEGVGGSSDTSAALAPQGTLHKYITTYVTTVPSLLGLASGRSR